MPYKREGALKVSEHWVRSPLLEINRSCQPCHPYGDEEIKARVEAIQDRHFALLTRAGQAATSMLDAVAAENSMGFHAPQEMARILGESIDLSRQAQVKAVMMLGGKQPPVLTEPSLPLEKGNRPAR